MIRVVWNLLKPLLFLFDAERVHDVSVLILSFLGRRSWGRTLLALISGTKNLSTHGYGRENRERIHHFALGMPFRSRVGLAAGFDKNGELIEALPSLGFGFVEVGTVTPRPQEGNPKPRLFRKPEERLLFNRMGFNGKGAEYVSQRVREAKFSGALPVHFRIGLNIGKNKTTTEADAHLDYAEALKPFKDLVDYVVVNLSSPNTPGLRALQAVEPLQKILKAVHGVLADWSIKPPVLVKLAPELREEELGEILAGAEAGGAAGFVLANTWAGEWRGKNAQETFQGGWSGKILLDPATRILEAARRKTKLPLISVGGILNNLEAKRRISLGADLIQIYTGWIYGGPTFARELSDSLVRHVNS